MTELILQTDPLEFQNSRQSTKIMFLQQELQQAQDYARDLEHIVKVNKEVLRIATSQQPRPTTKSKGSAQNESASTFDTSSNRGDQKNFQLLVEQLQDENIKLLEIIEKAKKERNTAQSKALISEQICEEAQRHESETVHELEEKITELRKLLQDKEYAIQELEKIKPITEQEGVVIKYREVMAPTEQNIKFHNEIDALNGMLSKVSKELNKLQTENHELVSINFSLTTELAKIKATLISPLNQPPKFGFGRAGTAENGNDQPIFQAPLEFLDENSPFPSPLPSHAAFEAFHSKAPVPKLDLSKAKQIQEQYAKKLSQPQQQNYNGGYDVAAVDKLKQFEEELELTRKKLSHEMINNRLVSEELSRAKKQTSQLMAVNEILIKSNKRYEEKWCRIFYTLEFYKDFYHKYIDHIAKGNAAAGHGKSSSVSTPKFEMLPKFRGNVIDADPERLIREFKKISEETGKQLTMGIMEANEEDELHDQINKPKEKPAETFELTKDQCKVYLLNLSKDLYVKTHLRSSSISRKVPQLVKEEKEIQQVQEQPAIIPIVRLRRSLSNPLEYASETKKVVYEKEPIKDKNIFKIKNSKRMLGVIDDQNEGVYENLETSGMQQMEEKIKAVKHEGGDEMISFSVDVDEFNKNKMVEVSFISNNDILDNLRNN